MTNTPRYAFVSYSFTRFQYKSFFTCFRLFQRHVCPSYIKSVFYTAPHYQFTCQCFQWCSLIAELCRFLLFTFVHSSFSFQRFNSRLFTKTSPTDPSKFKVNTCLYLNVKHSSLEALFSSYLLFCDYLSFYYQQRKI